ncbi:tryptophan 2,3-dioxygenase [Micromonospora sp. WMMD723]|uniref:tryptophan 2,3-dioxygenase n=1 Tax=Micromonospora sp. WMMD723 TaxID=3403465 RepID=UPI003CF55411
MTLSADRDGRHDDPSPSCPYLDDHTVPSTAYAAYAHMDALLTLQHPQTRAAAEPGFIIMSQVMELLFKLLHIEFAAARDQLSRDGVAEALWTLRRAVRVQQAALSSWDFFSAMTPGEFAEFRDVLGEASGFQSASYRRLEFLLGNKNPHMVKPHRGKHSSAAVQGQLQEPSLYDAVLGVLRRRGMAIVDEVFTRAADEPYEPHGSVEQAWREVYADPVRHHDLYLLGESLMDVAESFARWRYTHLTVVQRILGGKSGTGGTEGVPWLTRISEHRFFPELWSMRTSL